MTPAELPVLTLDGTRFDDFAGFTREFSALLDNHTSPADWWVEPAVRIHTWLMCWTPDSSIPIATMPHLGSVVGLGLPDGVVAGWDKGGSVCGGFEV